MQTFPLPDQLEIKHGEKLGHVGPEAKQFYHPDSEPATIGNIQVQRFDYRLALEDKERGVILLDIAHDTEANDYYIFIEKAGISPEEGLISMLDYSATITDSERIEDYNSVPERVIEAVNEYFEQNHGE